MNLFLDVKHLIENSEHTTLKHPDSPVACSDHDFFVELKGLIEKAEQEQQQQRDHEKAKFCNETIKHWADILEQYLTEAYRGMCRITCETQLAMDEDDGKFTPHERSRVAPSMVVVSRSLATLKEAMELISVAISSLRRVADNYSVEIPF